MVWKNPHIWTQNPYGSGAEFPCRRVSATGGEDFQKERWLCAWTQVCLLYTQNLYTLLYKYFILKIKRRSLYSQRIQKRW